MFPAMFPTMFLAMVPALVPAMVPAMIPLLAVVLPATAQSPQCSGPLDKVRSSNVFPHYYIFINNFCEIGL